MMRRYAILLAIVLAGALAVRLLARMPRAAARAPEVAEALAVTELRLSWADGRLAPETASVPRGNRVRLTIENHDRDSLALRLAGYEDRLALPRLAPGAAWSGEFVADRPGDDFAWLIEGRPEGRLAVTGSHLIEGHR